MLVLSCEWGLNSFHRAVKLPPGDRLVRARTSVGMPKRGTFDGLAPQPGTRGDAAGGSQPLQTGRMPAGKSLSLSTLTAGLALSAVVVAIVGIGMQVGPTSTPIPPNQQRLVPVRGPAPGKIAGSGSNPCSTSSGGGGGGISDGVERFSSSATLTSPHAGCAASVFNGTSWSTQPIHSPMTARSVTTSRIRQAADPRRIAQPSRRMVTNRPMAVRRGPNPSNHPNRANPTTRPVCRPHSATHSRRRGPLQPAIHRYSMDHLGQPRSRCPSL